MRWIGYLILIMPLSLWANCDLATFRWQCDLRPKLHPAKNLVPVYCDGTPVYVTHMQQKIIKRYIRARVNMVLKVNDEYFAGPCKLAS